jgi:hypothetical protein
LTHCHVSGIKVWAFFTVYFYAYKRTIEKVGYLLVFKGFFLHNVAPVACRVAYGDKDWFVLVLGFLECFLAPWVPVYGVIGVLK